MSHTENKEKREVDYEWAERQAYFKNLKAFLKNPFDNESLKRMQSYSKKHFIPIDKVMSKVKEDEIFARNFVKDPVRQSIHENEAAKFIKRNEHIKKFKKLPVSGANSLFLHEGKIITKKEKDLLNLPLKSVDFYWEIVDKSGETFHFYASHKYTNEEGGAQDHQYTEQRKFLENANNSKMGNNVFFIALCEGNYYRKPNKKENKSRIDLMNENDISKQSIAIPLCDLDDYIENKISTPQPVKTKKRTLKKKTSI